MAGEERLGDQAGDLVLTQMCTAWTEAPALGGRKRGRG